MYTDSWETTTKCSHPMKFHPHVTYEGWLIRLFNRVFRQQFTLRSHNVLLFIILTSLVIVPLWVVKSTTRQKQFRDRKRSSFIALHWWVLHLTARSQSLCSYSEFLFWAPILSSYSELLFWVPIQQGFVLTVCRVGIRLSRDFEVGLIQ